jgi:hypothetical protein
VAVRGREAVNIKLKVAARLVIVPDLGAMNAKSKIDPPKRTVLAAVIVTPGKLEPKPILAATAAPNEPS